MARQITKKIEDVNPSTTDNSVEENKESVTETKKATEKKTETVKKKTFDPSDGILCRSVTQGKLFYEGTKTGILYTFSDYGDEVEIEYRDLVAAVRSRAGVVFNPYFIVEDNDFLVDQPALGKFYSESYTKRDLRAILNDPINEMIEELKALPQTALDNLKIIAATQIKSGELDSVRKIRALDEFFGTNMELLSELFN